MLIPSRTPRRLVVLIALGAVTGAFLSLYALSWPTDTDLTSPVSFGWPSFSHPHPPRPAWYDQAPAEADVLVPPSTSLLDTVQGPPISIVIIWKGNSQPYIPGFAASVLANNRSLEVLWVGIKEGQETTCFDPLEGRRQGGENLHMLCLSEEEYWSMHRDYFCERWSCTEEERKVVFDTMMDRRYRDYQHSFFRLWRGYVFRDHISRHARWWGWADPDTFLGDFATQFPWQEAQQFDLFSPSSENHVLYLRGHLQFFLLGKETEGKLCTYPNLVSVEAYMERHIAEDCTAMEEAEFSAFIMRNPAISLLIDTTSLVEIPLHLASRSTPTFATLQGVFGMHQYPTSFPDFPDIPVLGLPGQCDPPLCPLLPPRGTIFSERGVVRPVELRAGEYEGFLWFNRSYVTEYLEPSPIPPELGGWTVYIGRGGGMHGGEQGMWTRFEPPTPAFQVPVLRDGKVVEGEEKVGLKTGLYLHWFHEKRGVWFSRQPGLEGGQALMSVWKEGGEVWEAGRVVWRSEV